MAEWPETAELAQVLDVENVEDWATTLDRVMAAAIEQVKTDVGRWDEYVDEPTESLSQAALRLAELIALKPEVAAAVAGVGRVPAGISMDPVYQRLLVGHRRRFGFA